MRFLLFIFLLWGFVCCSENAGQFNDKNQHDSVLNQWKGNSRSLDVLLKMFDQLGGRSKWANVKSLYVRYQQKDKQFGNYLSEQWQSLEEPKLIIDQLVEGARYVRILNDSLAWSSSDGSVEVMNNLNKNFLRYWHQLDFFKCLHEIAIGDGMKVHLTDENEIVVIKNGVFYCGFILMDDFYPEIFHRPKFNEQDISLRLLEWKTKNGFKYPYRGEALKDEFSFEISEIDFSNDTAENAFGVQFKPTYLKGE